MTPRAIRSRGGRGLRRREIDIGGLVIRAMERLGLAWKVVRISPDRQQAKTVDA